MSTLHVENLKGLSSGGNANKVILSSDQTLYSPGHVVQTVLGPSFGLERTIGATSFTLFDSALAATITPNFSTSKILVTCTIGNFMFWSSNTTDARVQFGISRDSGSSFIREYNNRYYNYGSGGAQIHYTPTLVHLDSPSSTSALTYNLYGKAGSTNADMRLNDDQNQAGVSGTAGACFTQFILQEIAQ